MTVNTDALRTFRMPVTRVPIPQRYCPEIEEFCRQYWQWIPEEGHWETRADWKSETGEWVTCRHVESDYMWDDLLSAARLYLFDTIDSLKEE